MSSTYADEDEAFERRLKAKAADRRRERLKAVGIDGVIWLALVPAWTQPVARACRFPTGNRSIKEFVAGAEAAGICVSAKSSSPERAVSQQVRVLCSMGGYLSQPLIGTALALVARLPQERQRAQGLVDLAPALAPSPPREAVDIAQHIKDPRDRATALIALAGVAQDDRGNELLAQALGASRAIPDPASRAPLMAGLCRSLSGEQQTAAVRETVQAASEIPGERERTSVLVSMGSLLPERKISEVISSTIHITDLASRAQAMATVAAAVPGADKVELLHEATGWAADATDPAASSAALIDIVTGLADAGDLRGGERAATVIRSDAARGFAFGIVARAAARAGESALVDDLTARVIPALAVTVDPAQAVTVLGWDAQMLFEGGAADHAAQLADEGRQRLSGLGRPADNVHALQVLAQAFIRLGDTPKAHEIALEALAATRTINGRRKRASILLALLPLLPEETQAEVRREALQTVRDMSDPLQRASVFPALLPQLEEAERNRLCEETLQLAAAGTELSFWMPDSVRDEIVKMLNNLPPDDSLGTTPLRLQEQAADIARRIISARDQGESLDPPISRWAELASRIDPRGDLTEAAHWFDEQIGLALEAPGRAVKAPNMGAALEWIGTGSALAEVFGDELSGIVRYAKRRVELIDRGIEDDQYLTDFLERQDQLEAFEELLVDDGSRWALHYIGAGGVGKTTLLRYLTRLADHRNIVSSRMDFDYLRPDYPVRRPAQLLLELMGELRRYVSSPREESVVDSFHDTVIYLHEATAEGTAQDPLAGIHGQQFQLALQSFSDYLRLLNRPVVLFLDTCEELARFQPEGARLPNVEATFEVLERIHAAVGRVRVVFAGRRLLARSGHGWSVPASEGSLLPVEKDYLRLREIRGFTEEEARVFLTQIKKLDVSPEIEEKILKASRDTGKVANITWDPARPPSVDRRYNPFDLAMYADWVRGSGSAAITSISSADTDPYIERRIIGRIDQDEVRRLLPAAVLLRRFDKELLRPAFAGSDTEFSAAYRGLVSQEWVEIRQDDEFGVTSAQIDPNLYPRLRAFYQDERRTAYLTSAAEALSPVLEHRVERSSLGNLSAEIVNSAIDVASPARAAALWHRLSLRVASDERWDWAQRVTGRLLAEDGAVHLPTHPVRADVRALFTSARLHAGTAADLAAHWAEVGEAAGQEPDPVLGDWLKARSRAGVVSAGASGTIPARPAVESFFEALSRFPDLNQDVDPFALKDLVEQLAASCCAALEGLLEVAERSAESPPDADLIARWAASLEGHGVSRELRGFARVLAARALAQDARWSEAEDELSAGERLVSESAGTVGQHWMDWVAPASLQDRIRLEALRIIPRSKRTPDLEQAATWADDAARRLSSVDAERLVSAVLQLRMDHGLPDAAELEAWEAADAYEPQRQPACNAHAAVAPLFVSIALGWLALGNVGRAMGVLDARLAAAAQTGLDSPTVHAAEEAKLRVLRRMRLSRSADSVLVERMARSADPREAILALSVLALTKGPEEVETTAVPPGVKWRCQTALPPGAVDRLREIGGQIWADDEPLRRDDSTAAQVERALDYQEWLLVTGEKGTGRRFPAARWAAAHSYETDQAIRFTFRAAALGVLEDEFELAQPQPSPADAEPHALTAWIDSVGYRRLAEIALEEGELLALRLPERALLLLRFARSCFDNTADSAGQLIATVRTVLATAHAKPTATDRSSCAADLRHAYQIACQAGILDDQPAFAELTERAKHPAASYLTPLPRSDWEGWIQRLSVCLVWCHLSPHDRIPELAQGSTGGPPPVELDLDPAETPAPRRSRIVLSRIGQLVGTAVLSFIVYFAAILGIQAGFPELGGWWLAGASFGAAFGASFLVNVVAGLTARRTRIREQMNAFLVARTAIRFTVAQTGGPSVTAAPWPAVAVKTLLQYRRPKFAASKLTLARALWLYWDLLPVLLGAQDSRNIRLGPVQSADQEWKIPALGPYDRGAKTLPATFANELNKLREQTSKAAISIPVEVPASLAGLPWEAFLSLAPGLGSGSPDVTAIYRRANPLASSKQPQGVLDRGGIHVVTSRTWRLMAERGWRASTRQVTTSEYLPHIATSEKISVLHLIGRPVSTPRGYLLQVAGGEDRLSAGLEESVRATGILLDPASLPLDSVDLVVVQAEPFETSERVDTDRKETAKLRIYANNVFMAGARSVVMLPALPPTLSDEVLSILAARLQRSPLTHFWRWTDRIVDKARQQVSGSDPTFLRLLGAMREVRRVIAGQAQRVAEPTDPAIYLELSLDACMFVRHELTSFPEKEIGSRQRSSSFLMTS